MYQFDQLTLTQLRALAAAHVAYFEGQAALGERGGPTVNLGETRAYLALWQDALEATRIADTADAARAAMTPEQRAEYEDALETGDYDRRLREWGAS